MTCPCITPPSPLQTAWNDVIIAFLWGMGLDGQLRFRLLPVESYSNVGNYDQRKQQGLPLDQVVLHAGGLHSGEKVGAVGGGGQPARQAGREEVPSGRLAERRCGRRHGQPWCGCGTPGLQVQLGQACWR